MSREYKFRVYSFVDKEFIYFDIYDYPQGIAGGVSEPQEYTGLKDKNGKEIYEGDILQFSDEDKGDEPCEVVYELGMFGCNIIDTSNNKDFWQLYYIVTKLKPIVIGNIFEHSELLK